MPFFEGHFPPPPTKALFDPHTELHNVMFTCRRNWKRCWKISGGKNRKCPEESLGYFPCFTPSQLVFRKSEDKLVGLGYLWNRGTKMKETTGISSTVGLPREYPHVPPQVPGLEGKGVTIDHYIIQLGMLPVWMEEMKLCPWHPCSIIQ